ncbi:MAG: hypothetical protein V4773_09315, partial [Verrucomicrobiota bacterium]
TRKIANQSRGWRDIVDRRGTQIENFPTGTHKALNPPSDHVKKPNRDERQRMCTTKRRYSTQANALDAAALAGIERRRSAYLCPLCGKWHLTSR